MKETISKALKLVGKKPLERLDWAVDFSQRSITTPDDQSNAELELTCFFWAMSLLDHPSLPITRQINALMTERPWVEDSYRGQEVQWAQQTFTKILIASASDREIELPLRHVTAKFTRGEGLELVSVFRSEQSAQERAYARREAIAFKLIRLLDKRIVTGTRRTHRLTPMRHYVGICPKEKDGCGKLFAKTRIDKEHCSDECINRWNVYRFRRTQKEALVLLYPGKRMSDLTEFQRNRVRLHAKSLR